MKTWLCLLLLSPFALAAPERSIHFQVYPPNAKIFLIVGVQESKWPIEDSGVVPNQFFEEGRGDLEFVIEDPKKQHEPVTIQVHKNSIQPGQPYIDPNPISLKPIGLAALTDWFLYPTWASYGVLIGTILSFFAYRVRRQLRVVESEEEARAKKIHALESLAGVTLSPEKSFFDRVGNFYILKPLGRGGMGEVSLACHVDHINPQGLTAIKRILDSWTSQPDAINLFLRECKRHQEVHHPNVISILESGKDGDGLYLAMEYVPGHTFRSIVQRSAPMPLAQAMVYFRQIAQGLQAIHARDISHRDMKPENMLVNPQGQLKISDFGNARKTSHDTTHMTQVDLNGGFDVRGTPGYLAPELWTAFLTREEDPTILSHPAVDQFAIGVILYELLSGRLPQASQDATVLCQGTMIPITNHCKDLPEPVVRIIHRMLAGKPQDRFPSVGEALQALEGAL